MNIGQRLSTSMRGLRLTFFIASRYLFSKKSRNAINIISSISVLGVVVSTAALVCVMSVFNGFVDTIEKSLAAFDPELQITAARGKTFDCREAKALLDTIDNVEAATCVLQDDALIAYYDSRTPFTLKGVDSVYRRVFAVDSLMIDGSFKLYDFDFDVAAVGIGLASKLNLGVDYVNGLTVYVPQRRGRVNLARPDGAFKRGELFVCGVFSAEQPEVDDNTLIVPIEFARKMYDYDSLTVSAIDIKLHDVRRIRQTQQRLYSQLGSRYLVRDRNEQQQDYFKIIKIERMIVFVILSFMVFVAICNIIGSISMLLIDKRSDIDVVRYLGLTTAGVRRIFIVEGWLMSLIGVVVGIAVGAIVCLLQWRFGFITMGQGAMLESYPVLVRVSDIVVVFVTVAAIGWLTSLTTVWSFFRSKAR